MIDKGLLRKYINHGLSSCTLYPQKKIIFFTFQRQIKILNNVMRNQLFPEFDSHLSYKTFLLQSNGSKSLGACSVTPL